MRRQFFQTEAGAFKARAHSNGRALAYENKKDHPGGRAGARGDLSARIRARFAQDARRQAEAKLRRPGADEPEAQLSEAGADAGGQLPARRSDDHADL